MTDIHKKNLIHLIRFIAEKLSFLEVPGQYLQERLCGYTYYGRGTYRPADTKNPLERFQR